MVGRAAATATMVVALMVGGVGADDDARAVLSSFAAIPAARGVLGSLTSRKTGSPATVADLAPPAGHGDPTSTYPCYQTTCAGNASCCHYGGADMCCWNGSPPGQPGGIPGPVSWHCGGVAFGMHPKGLCCPPESPFGCPGFDPGNSCCPSKAPICCQSGGCCPLGTACNGVKNGTAHCIKLPTQ